MFEGRVGEFSHDVLDPGQNKRSEREFFIDNLLVRIHLIIVMIRWTGLAPWELETVFEGRVGEFGHDVLDPGRHRLHLERRPPPEPR